MSTRAVSSWLISVVALALSGCGGNSYSLGGKSEGVSVGASHAGRCEVGAATDLIDDMEDSDGSLLLRQNRAGVWFSYNDETNNDPTTAQWPKAGAESFFMDPVNPKRGTSASAAHTHGSNYNNWGAGIGFDLLVQQAYDASYYSGLTFYLKREEGHSSFVRLNVTDRNSSPLGNVCDDEKGQCYSDFGFDLDATTEWQQVTLKWADLSQPSWTAPGDRYPAIVTSALFGIRFQAQENEDFDFWVDDIAFLCP